MPRRLSTSSGLLSMILNQAIAEERIVANVTKGVPLPKVDSREAFFLTEDQLALVVANATTHQTLIRLIGWCGLRVGEGVALRVENLDLIRAHVHIVESATEVGREMIIGPPKAKLGKRTVRSLSRCARSLRRLWRGRVRGISCS